ncbi:hypothetical protein CHLNCDRAFT_49788 [Chlorella variabilis]|uniref:Uncharacterized protein n=1 Tax=Chlorella variabilis TaxID=554065 RepID=E1Z420_CHLVA|nr:hypothetical protein CHLNCDRAFT_49788 [Chlorella variabilis]EFN59274.1 hypothetical protein CHLNCDRAFT_49788 [Chlorella variabilis]|eukprot:XP_005851376.1 hypothetical protein CHLNCDRAFT_49788 [Chlorella variabilis]
MAAGQLRLLAVGRRRRLCCAQRQPQLGCFQLLGSHPSLQLVHLQLLPQPGASEGLPPGVMRAREPLPPPSEAPAAAPALPSSAAPAAAVVGWSAAIRPPCTSSSHMDADEQHRIAVLVERICSKRNPALDGGLLAQIKALCKQGGDPRVIAAWQALWGQLRAPHSQTRLLALLVCEQLFQRSRAFRLALLAKLMQARRRFLAPAPCSHPLPAADCGAAANASSLAHTSQPYRMLTQSPHLLTSVKFLEAVLGVTSDRPLPPPPDAATSLREKALEVVEGWELPLAVRYLRDTLQCRFPGTASSRAAAAEAQRAARERQQQLALRQRLAAMLGGSDAGPGEWQEGSSAARQLLAEMQECFAILDEQQQDQQQRPHPEQAQQEAAAAAAEADGMQWEDVAAAEPAPAGERDPGLAEGLAAYGAGHAPDAEAAGTSAAQPDGGSGGGGGGGGGGDADMDVVLETLAGLYRQLTNRTLPQVQEWLGVLGRVEPEGAAQEQQRQQLLRAATQLRGQLAAAKARCEASDLDLQALLLQRRRRQREQQQQSEGQAGEADAPAVATALQDLFGGSGSEGEDDGEGSGSGEGALGKQRQQQQQQRNRRHSGQRDAAAGRSSQRQQGRQEEEEEWESPYLRIVDPAAPRPRPQASDAAGQQRKQQEARGDRAAAAAARRESSLPEDVRKKLAAQAPVLPSGTHTIFWDSQAELPQERLDELFMIPMPASRQAAQQQQAYQQHAERRRQQQEQQQQQEQEQEQQQRGTPSVAQQWPSRQGGGAGAADEAGPSSQGAAAGPSTSDGRAGKKARRAQERAYNEAVIGGADRDEALARQLQDAEGQPQGAEGGGGAARGGRGRGKKMGVRKRLAQKLLRGSAVAAAVADATLAESEARRDKFGNRW